MQLQRTPQALELIQHFERKYGLADSCGALQAKSQGNSDMIDRLDVRCRLMELQQRLVSNLEASSSQVCTPLASLLLESMTSGHASRAYQGLEE